MNICNTISQLESYPRYTYSNMDRHHKHTVSDKSDAHINAVFKDMCTSKTIKQIRMSIGEWSGYWD